VDQARGKGVGRGVQYIPVGPVRLDVDSNPRSQQSSSHKPTP